jgi:4'-phosphopantetheinyl transferase EntD
MLEGLLPPDVVTRHGDPREDSEILFPEEEALIARAVPKRQREFRKARECARAALARLGIEGFPLLSGSGREPLWPSGVAGSLTHTEGFCAAAVAPVQRYPGIGIDAEPDEPLTADIVSAVCDPQELATSSASTTTTDTLRVARLLFSAKESVYKCQFPISRRFLGFEDLRIELDPEGTFRVIWRITNPPFSENGYQIRGSWLRRCGYVLTAAWLEG